MVLSIINLPDDIFYVISKNIDYFSYINLQNTCKSFTRFKMHFFNKKANIIINFFKNKFYYNFKDLKNMNRSGHLINLDTILQHPEKYKNEIIQCISWFQYNHTYIEASNIIEGFVYKHLPTDAWVIYDIETTKLHPFINPFIFPRSIRIIK